MTELSTAKKRKGLGRGLETLLGPNLSSESPVVMSLSIKRLRSGKYQPRATMDEGALNDLIASIREQGVMQPILVRPVSDDKGGKWYEIIAGERRYRAAKMAGLKEIPAIVKDVDDKSAAAMALIENIQRENLNPLEEAFGIQRLIKDFSFTHEQAAQSIGRSRSAVTNLLRLLNLTEPVQTMLKAGDIEMGHARALLSVNGATQIALATQIISKRLSVREAERLVAAEMEKQKDTQKKAAAKSQDLVNLETELSDLLTTKVSLKMGTKGKGKIIIDFANLDVLDGLLARIRQSI